MPLLKDLPANYQSMTPAQQYGELMRRTVPGWLSPSQQAIINDQLKKFEPDTWYTQSTSNEPRRTADGAITYGPAFPWDAATLTKEEQDALAKMKQFGQTPPDKWETPSGRTLYTGKSRSDFLKQMYGIRQDSKGNYVAQDFQGDLPEPQKPPLSYVPSPAATPWWKNVVTGSPSPAAAPTSVTAPASPLPAYNVPPKLPSGMSEQIGDTFSNVNPPTYTYWMNGKQVYSGHTPWNPNQPIPGLPQSPVTQGPKPTTTVTAPVLPGGIRTMAKPSFQREIDWNPANPYRFPNYYGRPQQMRKMY